jgi:small-conductance mechanosensitive channel
MEDFILKYIGEWGLFALSAFLGFAFKDTIQNFFTGLQFLWGHDFDVDDIVYIKGVKEARIVRQNVWKTTFYVLPHQRKFVVPNHLLWKLDIEKELPNRKD